MGIQVKEIAIEVSTLNKNVVSHHKGIDPSCIWNIPANEISRSKKSSYHRMAVTFELLSKTE